MSYLALLTSVALISTSLMPVASLATPAAPAPQVASTTQAANAKDYTILNIDGHEVKLSEVKTIWQSVFPEGTAPDFDTLDDKVKQNVLRGVIGEYLLLKQATTSGIEQRPEVQQKLEAVKKKVLVDAFLEEKAASQVTPAAVKQEYDKQKAELQGEMEVRASHILVKDKETAETLVKKLQEGADFDALAKENSTDKASAISGGDLGYFTKDRMVESFANAAFALEVGKLSEPVQSDFGWHIIKVTDKRQRSIKPFVEQRPAIEQQLRAEALKQYINDLVDSAKITYLSPEGKELELSKTPDSTEPAVIKAE